jgi:hypothetical protein
VQLLQNIFITIDNLEAFMENSSRNSNRQYIPHLNAKNTVVKVGSFVSVIDELQGSYSHDVNSLSFSCSTPRSAADKPILNIKSDIVENADQSLKGSVIVQTTVGQSFIEALQQQGMITSDKANELIHDLKPITYESNQKIKQIYMPIG